MRISTFLFKHIMPIPNIMDYQSYAFVGPHPDDIELQCAGTISKLVQSGKNVTFIIVTDGRFGTMDARMNPEDIVNIRKQEALQAACSLGVLDVRFLGFHDGGRYEVDEVADKLAIEFSNIQPDIIFTVDPHVKAECHIDHIKVGRASEIALFRSSNPLMMKELGIDTITNLKGISYYFTDKANSFIKISPYIKQKIEAVASHKSQFCTGNERDTSLDTLVKSFQFDGFQYGFKCFARYAEGFRVLSINHLHCIPIASNF